MYLYYIHMGSTCSKRIHNNHIALIDKKNFSIYQELPDNNIYTLSYNNNMYKIHNVISFHDNIFIIRTDKITLCVSLYITYNRPHKNENHIISIYEKNKIESYIYLTKEEYICYNNILTFIKLKYNTMHI